MSLMTDKQAYAAMFRFLEELWEQTKSNDLGDLLSSMSMMKDGSTADPAVLNSWRQAVDYALNGGEPGTLDLRK